MVEKMSAETLWAWQVIVKRCEERYRVACASSLGISVHRLGSLALLAAVADHLTWLESRSEWWM